ncbi:MULTISPECIES: 2-octaprenyl-6-methoxyphenyl hydroxylase [Spongiibacter]|uniref:2-octaprenyl-6-methoxyphenyl hydroxylase n=1 Tax=Spongiibacter TaxID=630749 RepID=UPI001B08AC54|nr:MULTISPECIES: 2-octaprenyl-6-methoxyphenyl hydroxylase [Spongiibacter]MBO6752959.1 2-octaprenyl-6-methoxyphenyl hydroxylase [Spongiibacter sp.]
MSADYDVLIAGGGMVGASLALCLHHHSRGKLNVAVVESFPLPPLNAEGPTYRPSFDARSTALSYGSRRIYDELGLWPTLRDHVADITQIQVSDRGHFGGAMMRCEELQWPALGYVVENAWLGNVLLNHLRRHTNVDFISPATVEAVSLNVGAASLDVRRADAVESLSAKLLVVADGAASGLCDRLGIHRQVDEYAQTAVIANIATERAHDGMAYERFTAEGPMAMLPLLSDDEGRSRSALVWTFPEDDADAAMNWSDEEFLRRLQEQFGYRLGRLLKVGQRARFPLQLSVAEEQVRRHVVVMGNAAHALHPVAGQGYNLALRDADALAREVSAAAETGESPGELAVLQRYLRGQYGDQLLTTLFSDRVTRLFSNRQPVLSLARNLGLALLDSHPPLKSRFTARAAGVMNGRDGELPR